MASGPSKKALALRLAIGGWIVRRNGDTFTSTSVSSDLGLDVKAVGYDLLRREELGLLCSVGYDKAGPSGGRPSKLYKQKWLSR